MKTCTYFHVLICYKPKCITYISCEATFWHLAKHILHKMNNPKCRNTVLVYTIQLASPSRLQRRRQWHPTPVLLPGKSMDGGAWWADFYGVAKSQTQLRDFTFTFHFHALKKEMTTHSSVLAWRIPGTAEPGGLPSMGSYSVRHDWRDLAAAAAVDYRASFWDCRTWLRDDSQILCLRTLEWWCGNLRLPIAFAMVSISMFPGTNNRKSK